MVVLNRKKGRKVTAIVTEARCVAPGHVTKQTPPSSLADMFGELALVFRPQFKSRCIATRRGKPKIGLKHIIKSRCLPERFQDYTESSSSHGGRKTEFRVSVCDAAPGAQVLAVVFDHFILSGILALEANMLI